MQGGLIKSITCVAPVGNACGEGAVWDDVSRVLYWCDVTRFLIQRLDPVSRAVESWLFDEPVVALSLCEDPDLLLVALGSKLIWWRPETDERRDHGFVLPDYPNTRLNDGRADPLGNFWVGSMRNNVRSDGELIEASGSEGSLYRVSPNCRVTVWETGIGVPNTLCWSPDRRTFYTGDSARGEIYAYDFNSESGDIGAKRLFHSDTDRGVPDGSAIDVEGHLWNCRFAGRAILRIAPNGRDQQIIEMPVCNITTAAFGGPCLRTLYVTSASILRPQGDRLAGSLWAIETATSGLRENRVKISKKSDRARALNPENTF
jgi:sugar lactone lactonase YvrE